MKRETFISVVFAVSMLILALLMALSGKVKAEDTIPVTPAVVESTDKTTFKSPYFNYNVNNNFDETLRPANLKENHYIGKCDSDAVKKRAHKWGFMGYQKQLDVQMQTSLLKTCELLVNVDPAQAVACIREYGDQQREQRKDGASAITTGINAGSLTLQVIRGFTGR